MAEIKGKIGVLIEDHFDATEFRRFNEYFPKQGYEVEYISHLWGQPELHFGSNPENNKTIEATVIQLEINLTVVSVNLPRMMCLPGTKLTATTP